MSVDMTRLDALRGLLAMSEDYRDVDPICETCRESESSCLCESDLQGALEDAMRSVKRLSNECDVKQAQIQAAEEFARRLLESATLDEAKTWARDFLGIEPVF
jgi:hypothetical protein